MGCVSARPAPAKAGVPALRGARRGGGTGRAGGQAFGAGVCAARAGRFGPGLADVVCEHHERLRLPRFARDGLIGGHRDTDSACLLIHSITIAPPPRHSPHSAADAPVATTDDRPMNTRIPATVITGFLGAGKTSMIRHLLANANGRRMASSSTSSATSASTPRSSGAAVSRAARKTTSWSSPTVASAAPSRDDFLPNHRNPARP